jgi:hypothetical protein
MTDTRGAINDLLALGRWHLNAMGLHYAELRRLTAPLLTEEKADLGYEEMRLCARLDDTIYGCGLHALSLLGEVRGWGRVLTPEQAAEVVRQRAEHDRIVDEWRNLMEAVQHVWADQKPPQ